MPFSPTVPLLIAAPLVLTVLGVRQTLPQIVDRSPAIQNIRNSFFLGSR